MKHEFTVTSILEDARKKHDALMVLVEQNASVPFLYMDRDENIRDVLYHLYGWHQILTDLMTKNPKPPIELRPGYTWKNLTELNYKIKKEAESYTLHEVKHLFNQSHNHWMSKIAQLFDHTLNAVGLYPFTAPSNLGEFIHECMGGHYEWAIQTIEFHLGDPYLRPLLEGFKSLPEVEAIVLGGSRGKQQGDHLSDYDIYVYATKPIDVEERKRIIGPHVSLMEYNHQFFETEDDGVLNNGIGIEFIYRNLDDFKAMMERLFNGQVNRGYSTCFLDNLLTTKIIYDKKRAYKSLQDTYRFMDKTALYQQVIRQNIPLLYGTQPNYFDQIVKAVKRQDIVAVNHRLTEYFSLFFDTLFAINQINHPGEKRMLEKALSLPKQPKELEKTVGKVFDNITSGDFLKDLEQLTLDLIKLTK
ncbi:MAG: ClbS/DfsB family four-helix bundle protein [Acholeplasma sp.]|jgi:predicted nucleotidyltransferase|nr:ClbS/DfsB family four-helix bundle protein [Acholeplasma sp.]